MATILYGADVAKAINEKTITLVNQLKEKEISPTLAILRVGERADDISYEKAAEKRCEAVGIKVEKYLLDATVDEETFLYTLEKLNNNNNIHGILMFRPLPKQIDNEKARQRLNPKKDVDGCTDLSLAAVFTNSENGFAPCTAQAAMEMLDYYKIDVNGKKAVILGRSLVVGKPVSMMLLNRNATVSICHTKTINIADISSKADIVIACTGQMESLTKEYFSLGQTVIDIGINYSPIKQKLCGDVLFEEVEPIVANISPVPKGVGSITTAVLADHVAIAAERLNNHY